jgi:hypothetical protein
MHHLLTASAIAIAIAITGCAVETPDPADRATDEESLVSRASQEIHAAADCCTAPPWYVYGEGWALDVNAACDLAVSNADAACTWYSGQNCCSKDACICGGGPDSAETGGYYACVVHVGVY